MTGDSRPMFERIARDVQERVAAGELQPGDPVPSGREVMDRWEVSKATANRAAALLKAWGLTITRVGAPTVVAEHHNGVPVSGPRERVERSALPASSMYAPGESMRVIDTAVITTRDVSADVAQAVGLGSPDPSIPLEAHSIVKRSRVMLRDDRPTGVCTTWFSHPLLSQQPGGPDVIDRLLNPASITGGTRKLVGRLVGVDVTHETHRVGVRPTPLVVARELVTEPGQLMLWVLTTRFADDYVIEVDEEYRLDDVIL